MELQPADRATLDNLLQLYVYDLSELLSLDVQDDGRYRTPLIDFDDPRCHPFVVRVDGTLAGFAVVKRRSRLSGDENVTDMAEFFILRRFRRQGLGEKLASALFDLFPGRWEVRQKLANQPATAFWRRVIGRYTEENFSEEILDDERWRGPVQRFTCSGSPGRRTEST
jgi:predicted acetyltransferase